MIHAAHRAEVHRTLAGSFGTTSLCPRLQDADDRDEDARDLPLALASRSKVATATAHLRLEELNVALSRRSPTQLLGVARSVGEAELAEARDRRHALAETACAVLPPRVRDGFLELCRRVFADAHESASSTKGRIRGPGNEKKEEDAYANWTRERVLWKVRIARTVFADDAEWFDCEYSGDVIGGLALIDALPLDPDDEFMRRAVRKLGIQSDPVAYLKSQNRLSEQARNRAFRRIVDTAEELGGSSAGFLGRFPRIFRSWTRNEAPDKFIEFFDDPRELYHRSTESAINLVAGKGELSEEDRRVVEAAVPALERWIERLPGSTGPARTLARLLVRLGRERYTEARRVLEAAAASATAELGRREVYVALVGLELDSRNYSQAAARLRRLIADSVEHPHLRVLLVNAYGGWIDSGKDLPTVERLNEDFAAWEDPDTVHNRRALAVSLTIALHRERPDRDRLYLTAAGLRSLHEQDEASTEALYYLTVVLYQFARYVRIEIRGASGSRRKALSETLSGIREECADRASALDAGQVETHRLSAERRQEIGRILNEVRPAR